ncbi:unnamed protein product [Ambrosiozyma monospora]|uniref:Unnamed protein product n=1 Tax=Ambrosiozyma monospora TaxID=43982 RepID=A0A9W7DGZ5_AMBMO|nr:unnamed protein product [Ambrosiozyma monospora]
MHATTLIENLKLFELRTSNIDPVVWTLDFQVPSSKFQVPSSQPELLTYCTIFPTIMSNSSTSSSSSSCKFHFIL